MRILFINPPSINTISEAPSEDGQAYLEPEDFGVFPPLGILYIITYLEKHTSGHDLRFLDCVGENKDYNDLSDIVKSFDPDVVGITSFTISLVDVVKTAMVVRKIAANAHICMGGHHPIAFPFQAVQIKEFDSIVVGEGEKAFTELVKTIEAKGDISKIFGVYTRESIKRYIEQPVHDERFLSNVSVPPAYIEDLDKLPIPNRSYIRHIRYRSSVGLSDRLATIISSRGCPYRCTYCDVPYKRYRARSVENVVDEVQDCLDRGYSDFHFYDDLFNITPERLIAFCDEVERRDIKFKWNFRGRVNTVTRESLVRAKNAGCRMISFGVETGSDYGLQIIKKGTDVAKYKQVFKWCREIGISTIADFIIGFPFEKTIDDVKKNINYLMSLDPDFALIGILMLFPNTEIFLEGVKKGQTSLKKWIDFSLNPNVNFSIDYWTEHIAASELINLRKKFYKDFYIRPRYILRSIFSIRTPYEFKSKAKGFFSLLR